MTRRYTELRMPGGDFVGDWYDLDRNAGVYYYEFPTRNAADVAWKAYVERLHAAGWRFDSFGDEVHARKYDTVVEFGQRRQCIVELRSFKVGRRIYSGQLDQVVPDRARTLEEAGYGLFLRDRLWPAVRQRVERAKAEDGGDGSATSAPAAPSTPQSQPAQ